MIDDNDASTASTAMQNVAAAYPTLAPHLENTVVSFGQKTGPDDDRQLEFYAPGEPDNPTPGKIHLQIFNRDLQGKDLEESIAGDLLHHLGSVDPSTGQPVDPTFYALKQQVGDARTVYDLKMDYGAYDQEKANPSYQTAPYAQWDQTSRIDAYVRAGMFPDQNHEWKDIVEDPKMTPIFKQMKTYLRTGKTQ